MYEAISTIPVSTPFRLDLTVWVLRRREKNTIDRWDGQTYSRILVVDDAPVKLMVAQGGTPKRPHIAVKLQSPNPLTAVQYIEVPVVIQRVLGLTVDLRPFYAMVAREPMLEQLARPFIGVRPPRFPTVFEALVNAIACQQVSLDVGILLLNRLAERFGSGYPDGDSPEHAFPRPEDVFDIPEGMFKELGFSYQKARAIKELAYGLVSEELQLEQLELADNEQALAQLQAIHGIGRWSAEYALLRGLGRLDVFPGDDIGGQNNIQRLLQLETRPTYEQLKKLTELWHPYAGFVYFHLLLERLHAKGLV